jgi:hypothetical protein
LIFYPLEAPSDFAHSCLCLSERPFSIRVDPRPFVCTFLYIYSCMVFVHVITLVMAVLLEHNALKALREERSVIADLIVNTQAQIKRLQEKLEALDKAISNLAPFYEGPSEVSILSLVGETPGITDAVRMIFQSNASIYLAPTAIRDALKKDGLIKGYDNEMAVIHQVIRRLEDQGQIEPHPTEKVHRWIQRGSLREAAARKRLSAQAAQQPVSPPTDFGKKK